MGRDCHDRRKKHHHCKKHKRKCKRKCKPKCKRNCGAGSCRCIIPWPALAQDNVSTPIDLAGKVAVVTGVSRDQGRAVAQMLTQEGVTVIGTSRQGGTFPPGGPLVEGGYPLQGEYAQPYFVPQVDPTAPNNTIPGVLKTCDFLLKLDMWDETSINDFADFVHNLFAPLGPLAGKKLDILCPVAVGNLRGTGIGSVALGGQAEQNYVSMQKSPGMGMSLLWYKLLDLMPTDGYARIVNQVSISSISANIGDPLPGYSAGKAACLVLGDGLRQALHNITNGADVIPPYSAGDFADFKISNVSPHLVATRIGTITEAGPTLGDYQGPPVTNLPGQLLNAPSSGLGNAPYGGGIPSFYTVGAPNTPAFITAFITLLHKAPYPITTPSEETAIVFRKLLKMQDPFLYTRTTTKFQESAWNNIWCGSAQGLFPALRDCINTTGVMNTYTDDQFFTAIPAGTAIVNSPNNWDTASGTYPNVVSVGGKIPLVAAVFPLDQIFNVQILVNGVLQPGVLPYGTVVYENGVPLGQGYSGEVDISGFAVGTVIELQVLATNASNDLGTELSRVVPFVV